MLNAIAEKVLQAVEKSETVDETEPDADAGLELEEALRRRQKLPNFIGQFQANSP